MSSVNSNIVKFILTIILFTKVNTLNIPSYHKPCKFSDPKFEQCAVSDANAIMDNFRKGDATLIDARLKDLSFPFVTMTDNADIYINISNVHPLGYEDLKVLKVKKAPGKNRLETVTFVKDIKIIGDYSIDVVLNGKHIAGKGKGFVKYSGVHYNCNFEWNVVEKSGDKYLEVTKIEISTDVDNAVHEIDGFLDRALPTLNLMVNLIPKLEIKAIPIFWEHRVTRLIS